VIYVLYQYQHRDSGKKYIGVTNDVGRRAQQHASGKSGARSFNNAVKKYGIDAFEFKVLAIFDRVDAARYHEQAAIVKFGTLSPAGYNLYAGAPFTQYAGAMRGNTNGKGNLGKHHSLELRARQSILQQGHRSQSSEVRSLLSSLYKGKPGHSQSLETRAKISLALMGKSPSVETRAKIAEANAKRPPIADETRQKQSTARKIWWINKKEEK
jgi:group I intron endonuclease